MVIDEPGRTPGRTMDSGLFDKEEFPNLKAFFQPNRHLINIGCWTLEMCGAASLSTRLQDGSVGAGGFSLLPTTGTRRQEVDGSK